nr:putative capsid [Marmot picobirnavirus]
MAKQKPRNYRNRGNNSNNPKDKVKDRDRDGKYNSKVNHDTRKSSSGKDGVYPIVTGSSDNDATWYVPNGQMVKDVATFPVAFQSGLPVPVKNTSSLKATPRVNLGWATTPGIIRYDIMPTIAADMEDTTSPLSVAAGSLYQAIQSANSRTPSYEPADMMMYLVALTHAFSYYQWLVRVYGCIKNYEFQDRYTPEVLIQSMGVDYKSVSTHMADFRTGINNMAAIMASLYMPKTIDYSNRQIFLYESIYRDSNSPKAQYYYYNPVGFYVWQEGPTSAPDTHLTQLSLSNVLRQNDDASARDEQRKLVGIGYEELIDFGMSMVFALRNSEDIRMIGADMLQAFGTQSLFQVYPIAETFSVTPVYNPEVLSQMENAYISPCAEWKTISNTITQNTDINGGYLQNVITYNDWDNEFDTVRGSLDNFRPEQYMVNFHKENVLPEDILVATRLTQVPQFIWQSATATRVVTRQTEIVVGATIFMYTVNSISSGVVDFSVSQFPIHSYMMIQDANYEDPAEFFEYIDPMAHLSKFDWHPRVRLFTMSQEGAITPNRVSQFFFDLDNYVLMGQSNLHNLNYTCLLGLFTPKSLTNAIMLK